MATAVAVLLALTACGGGGSSSPTQPLTPAAPQNPSTPQAKTAKLAVSFTLPKGPATKSKKAHVKDITSTVTQIDVIYPNNGLAPAVDHFFPLTGAGSPCTNPTPGTFSCTIAVTAGTYPVQINTDNAATAALGVSPAQPETFNSGSLTSDSFTITPIVTTVASTTDSVRLPADGLAHTANITTTAVDPDGNLIEDPVVDATVFGSINIGTNNTGNVTFTGTTSFGDPGPTGSLATPLTFTESEAAMPLNTAFTVTPSYVQGSNSPFTFFAGTGTTPTPVTGAFPASSTPVTTFVATIAQSGPATGGTGNDDLYSGSATPSVNGNATQTLTFGSFDTYNGFTVTEFNAGAQADGSTANSTISFTTNCAAGTVTISPALGPSITPVGLSNNLTQTFNIATSAGAATCTATFFTSDWTSASILTKLGIFPPAQLDATVTGHTRKAK